MGNTLVDPTDLSDFPGAPFPESIVDSAVAGLRSDVGWHVAPEVPEIITLSHTGGRFLVLPTRLIVSVVAVNDIRGVTPQPITDFRVDKKAGVLERGWWPTGTDVIEVELTHGYEETPADLLPVLAERAQWMRVNSAVSQEQAGPFMQSIRDERATSREGGPSTLDHYTVHTF